MNMKEIERKKRILKLNNVLKRLFPDAKIALKYKTNWELLVAVVLSAQSTDKQVNKVTEKLFKKYKPIWLDILIKISKNKNLKICTIKFLKLMRH